MRWPQVDVKRSRMLYEQWLRAAEERMTWRRAVPMCGEHGIPDKSTPQARSDQHRLTADTCCELLHQPFPSIFFPSPPSAVASTEAPGRPRR